MSLRLLEHLQLLMNHLNLKLLMNHLNLKHLMSQMNLKHLMSQMNLLLLELQLLPKNQMNLKNHLNPRLLGLL